MYIYNKGHETKIVEKRFWEVEPGQIFLYSGVMQIKLVNPVYKCDVESEGPKLREINVIRISSPWMQLRDKYAGTGSMFSPDTIVEIYPDAAVYLKG